MKKTEFITILSDIGVTNGARLWEGIELSHRDTLTPEEVRRAGQQLLNIKQARSVPTVHSSDHGETPCSICPSAQTCSVYGFDDWLVRDANRAASAAALVRSMPFLERLINDERDPQVIVGGIFTVAYFAALRDRGLVDKSDSGEGGQS